MEDLKRLKLLIIVVCIMFGVMHLGGWVLTRRDGSESQAVADKVFSASLGHRMVGQVRTWRLRQERFTGSTGPVRGPAVEAAALVGIPFVRLAVAIPEAMLGVFSLQASTGAASGLSINGLGRQSKASPSSGAPLSPLASESPKDISGVDDAALPDVNECASTAFMHALMSSYCIGDNTDIAEQHVAYMARLRAAGQDDARYMQLYGIFKEMLMSGGLRSSSNWWATARLWRAVLLATNDGYWDADDSIAVTLLANTVEDPSPSLHGMQVLYSYATNALSCFASVLLGSSTSDAASELYDGRRTSALVSTPKARGSAAAHKDLDCPLAFTVDAIELSLPDELLAALEHAAALRVWTTALVLSFLRGLSVTWTADPDESETLCERARLWLQAQLAGQEALLARVMQLSGRQVAVWGTLHDRVLTKARGAQVATAKHNSLLVTRSLTSVVHSALTKHSTLGIWAAPEVVCSRRWQQFFLLITTLLAMLCCNIWLYWSRAEQCCMALHVDLGCPADTTLPCRGFTGTCADLADKYYSFARSGLDGGIYSSDLLACGSFPDENSGRDQFIAGLISTAVALPVVGIIATCFSLSLATDEEQVHGHTRLKRWSLLQRIGLGAAPWERCGGKLHELKMLFAGLWCTSWVQMLVVGAVDAAGSIYRFCRGARKEDTAAAGDNQLVCDAARFTRVTNTYRRGALFLLYSVWAVFVWCVCS